MDASVFSHSGSLNSSSPDGWGEGGGGVPDKSFAFGADAHGELMSLGQKQIFLNQWLGEVVALLELEIDWTSLSF
jgi:hypothetical protein